MRSLRISTSAFVTRRKQRDTLDIETSNRSAICRLLSWLARAQIATAICFWVSIQGFPNLLAFGMCSLVESKRLSISNTEAVMRKWLLKTSQWYRGTVASKYCEILAHFRLEKTQQLDNMTNSSSSLSSRRISSSSEKRNSEKTCGEVIQNKPSTSAILFSFAPARNPRKTHARDRVDWPFSLPFRSLRTSSLWPASSD